jgi:RNA polymerase sigma factor (sigma-70 family)
MIDQRLPDATARPSAPKLAALVSLLLKAAQDLPFGIGREGASASRVAAEAVGAEQAHADDALRAPGDEGRRPRSYLQRIKSLTKLSAKQESELFRIARDPQARTAEREAARRQLVRANLWVVPIIVRRYYRHGGGFEDLVAEGNMGLYKAFDRFNPGRGFRFSTYAKWWIVDAVTAAMAASTYPLRVPRKVALALARRRREEGAGGLAPTGNPLHPEDADEPQTLAVGDAEHGTPNGVAFAHQLTEAPVDQIVALRQALQLLADAVKALPARERQIIECRYGLNGQREHTLQEVGNALGVTAERVRVVQLAAMAKLRECLAGVPATDENGPDTAERSTESN